MGLQSQKNRTINVPEKRNYVQVHHLISLKAYWEVRTAQCASTKVNTLGMPYNLIIRYMIHSVSGHPFDGTIYEPAYSLQLKNPPFGQ